LEKVELKDEQDCVLPVPDTCSNISVGSESDKESAELSLWDDK
jgi:hypothetical protein